ncbi:RagB/SusD family nutrient uptake outer membrane protein, partial [Flavihumibacter sp. CACIAM 22H1]|uniref:RagB/SusD family nutrient uptake outer membrane protein n=1 Tax=Flavihumibacter sp. CACIAM 22H1 TaxID=1812911 RepID=UPI0007A8EC55
SELAYNADNGIVQLAFRQPYEIISRVNNLLQALPKYETGDTETDAKTIRGQALAIRAHAHFDLLRYFATSYDRNSSELAIPYVTSFDPLNPLTIQPGRNTVKEVYDQIFNDLEDALVAFDAGGNPSGNSSRYYIDQTVVYAMRARINLYAKNWQAAIDDATEALNNRPLTNASGYVAAFSRNNEATPSSEVYWAIPSDNALTPGGAISGGNPSYRVATPLSNVIKDLGGAYDDAGIILFNQTGIGGFQRTIVDKYAGVNSFKVFRAGEMMLIRAEAKHHLDDATALDDLNELRAARGVEEGTETGDDLLDAILLLRRVELLGEGHRWFDLKRTTRIINRSECGVADGSSSNNCSAGADSRSWAFPIPFNDIRVNPNLSQNPGY